MSSLAAWSYTSTATLWPWIGRDDVEGVDSFGPPEHFACDYEAKSMRMTDSRGTEFVTRQILHTERANIKQGDRVVIGRVLNPDPYAAEAAEVRAVTRYADTFDQLADDYEVAT